MAHRRLPDGTPLSVDDVVAASGRDRAQVMRAIDSRALRARQERGEWLVQVQDMRTWLSRG
jgi:hypothetical protein